MTLPTIHRNGTAASDLLKDLCEATDALRWATQKIQAAGPNGRDYYPQGPQAFVQAQLEHALRLEQLDAMRRDLEALAEHVSRNGESR